MANAEAQPSRVKRVLINSLKIVEKRPEDLRVVVLGAGAAGIACARIMLNFGVRQMILFDRSGPTKEVPVG